ncbi:4-coumarate--coa ligase-like 4 [Quercus suber]|uniref:4-coumarate--coa ligase-like 4 n=1 Tax=Quercus suber TaxID=58331 RepID=A0AAW0LX50_QUESU
MDQAAKSHHLIDSKSGFNRETKTFHSLRPSIHLPPQHIPMSAAEYAFSLRLLNSPWQHLDSLAFINSSTGQRVSFSEFISKTQTLASYLQSVIGLSKGDTAFVLSQNLVQVPILCFSLLSLGVVISPANPLNTDSEISRLIQLCNPVIAFSTSSSAHKLSNITTLRFKTILLDSPEFDSMTMSSPPIQKLDHVEVRQSDLAAIFYSSGTTGTVKGVMVSHRNLMANVAGSYANRTTERKSPAVLLCTVPYFHMYGYSFILKSVALSECAVVMERFDLRKMVRATEEFRVNQLALAPPLLVAMAKNDDVTGGCDLSSLEEVVCGGAPLGKDVISAFLARFPRVALLQGYGLTESTGGVFRTWGAEESVNWGAAGKLSAGFEAKIVNPDTSDALPPGKQGELWIKGPTIMKGYVGDPEATSATLVADGWLRTGDLCYIDEEGFLYVVDRLKELIKCKGYQVAPAELEHVLQSHPEIGWGINPNLELNLKLSGICLPDFIVSNNCKDVIRVDGFAMVGEELEDVIGLFQFKDVPPIDANLYPDEEVGQVPIAFVVRQPQSNLDEAEIMDFVAKQVAPYKKIRRVTFVNSLPKSAAGKLLRKDLRKIFQGKVYHCDEILLVNPNRLQQVQLNPIKMDTSEDPKHVNL